MVQRVVRIIRSRKAKVNFLKITAVVNNKNNNFLSLMTLQYRHSMDLSMFSIYCMIKVFRDLAWEREILSLRIECEKRKRGCDWTGQLRYYEVH